MAVHLSANYLAVKALCLDTLNEARLALIVRHYMTNKRVPKSQSINKKESIFPIGNPSKSVIIKIILLYIFFVFPLYTEEMVRYNICYTLFLAKRVCGFDIKIGVSFASVLKKIEISSMEMNFLLTFFEDRKYLITMDIETRSIFVILKTNAQPTDILEAYFYASMCGFYICIAQKIPIVSKTDFTFLRAHTHTICYIYFFFVFFQCRA